MTNELLPQAFLDTMSVTLRVMGHPYRLRVVEHLDLHGSQPGHALLAALGGAQGALSQHLARLRHAGVIRAERRGKEVWFALAAPSALTILNCMRNRVAAKPASGDGHHGSSKRGHGTGVRRAGKRSPPPES